MVILTIMVCVVRVPIIVVPSVSPSGSSLIRRSSLIRSLHNVELPALTLLGVIVNGPYYRNAELSGVSLLREDRRGR